MKYLQRIALLALTTSLLTGCIQPKEEGCPTCFHDYVSRYSIHDCRTMHDLTRWAACNTCPQCNPCATCATTSRTVSSNYWKNSNDRCREQCCQKAR